MRPTAYAIVVPTIGRPGLRRLLGMLAAQDGPAPAEVVVVDDRAQGHPLELGDEAAGVGTPVRVVRSFGHGPAAARNLGWQVARAPWIAFLDDDVELPVGWARALSEDLQVIGDRTGATQGRLRVSLPGDRRPTDSERGAAGLEQAIWATPDMAYRRESLVAVAGFDQRFPRAAFADADLALRVRSARWELTRGGRTSVHPGRSLGGGVGMRGNLRDLGNTDVSLMRALHGREWRRQAQVPPGRLRWHVAAATALVLALAAGLAALGSHERAGQVHREPRGAGARRIAALCALLWAGLTADLARRRIASGPRDGAEVRRVLVTSVAIAPVSVVLRALGWWRTRGAGRWPLPVAAVLLDRDGTLVHDVPYNGDPAAVAPVLGAAAALARLRERGVALGVITNQSGIGRGIITADQAAAVNAAVDTALGPFSTWQVCPHTAQDGCGCRKPAPGMVAAAAAALGVPASRVAVIGDIGADVEAARAAGARGVLVPTPTTVASEVADAPVVAADLAEAVDVLLALTPDPAR